MIGTNIKRMREMRGMTQGQLADKLTVSDGAVSAWEVGRNHPTFDMLERLTKALNCNITDLYDYSDYDIPAPDEPPNITAKEAFAPVNIEKAEKPSSGLGYRSLHSAKAVAEAQIDSPVARLGTLMGQAVKDPAAVKAIQIFMQLSPEDRQLALGMLEGLIGEHSQ